MNKNLKNSEKQNKSPNRHEDRITKSLIVPQGKWEQDQFGDEHFVESGIDQGKVELGRRVNTRTSKIKNRDA